MRLARQWKIRTLLIHFILFWDARGIVALGRHHRTVPFAGVYGRL